MSFREIGIQLKRQRYLFAGLDQVTLLPVEPAQHEMTLPRVIIDSKSLTQKLLRFRIFILGELQLTQQKRCIRRVGIDLPGMNECFFGQGPVVLIDINGAEC
jgi:hypothetical protein